jgi:hypothetical protein
MVGNQTIKPENSLIWQFNNETSDKSDKVNSHWENTLNGNNLFPFS